MFDSEQLDRLAPRMRGGPRLAELNGQGIAGIDPVAGTEAIAYDFLAKGGKHSRPFITLAVYDALTGGQGTLAGGAEYLATLPDSIKRAAMSIEIFHKASLVHDDIEDDDQFRYGDPTLHRKYGVATAINVGDYLIGLGYRLISRDAHAIGSDAAADVIDRLAEAHMRLTEGQGAELLWRNALDKRLKPIDALKIYALRPRRRSKLRFIPGCVWLDRSTRRTILPALCPPLGRGVPDPQRPGRLAGGRPQQATGCRRRVGWPPDRAVGTRARRPGR